MRLSDLDFEYPEHLIATEPARPTRVMYHSRGQNEELSIDQLLERFEPGEVLVVNDSKVLPRRVFSRAEHEIVFIDRDDQGLWSVLFPNRGMKVGAELELPGERVLRLEEKGIPQKVRILPEVDDQWFEQFGELPIPPYIQKVRQERHNQPKESEWYQADWAENSGSLAAPTASLHFTQSDLAKLEAKGVEILKVTLHVGLGTFLPIKTDELKDHQMHSEYYSLSRETAETVQRALKEGRRITTLGTTATRAIESLAQSDFQKLSGFTDLFIYPPYRYLAVGRLMTNFHQPKSTLLALVSAFAEHELVLEAYKWAIAREFRLFSYGDLSVWEPPGI